MKLRDFQEIRNNKKMSQSMVRSRKLDLATAPKQFQRKDSQEQSVSSDWPPLSFKERFGKKLQNEELSEWDKRKRLTKTPKYSRVDDQNFTVSQTKSSIQELITPVVQISYNQIKSSKVEKDQSNLGSVKQGLSTHRFNQREIMQTVSNLNKVLNQKVASSAKSESLNKSSFVSEQCSVIRKTPQVQPMKKILASSSFHQNLNTDIDDEWTDEHNPGENFLKNRANTIHATVSNNKRSMSEMQKSASPSIYIARAAPNASNRFKDRNKNGIFKTLNAVKTVSLNDLSGSTKSGGPSNSKARYFHRAKAVVSSYNGNLSFMNQNTAQLNSSKNNNSISSLNGNNRNFLIDLGNLSKEEPLWSPIGRDRSNTFNSSREFGFNKCKSSKSISSGGQGSSTHLKLTSAKGSKPKYRNVHLSEKVADSVRTAKADIIPPEQNFSETCAVVESPVDSNLYKKGSKIRGMNSIKNNLDVQKVRDAILGSINTSGSEVATHQNRKMRFLNSLDESKDLDLFKKNLQRDVNISNRGLAKNREGNTANDLIEKWKDVQRLLESSKIDQRKQSLQSDNKQESKSSNLSKRLAVKNDSIQKVEVFLASQENLDSSNTSKWIKEFE